MSIVDTHSHIYMEDFDSDIENVVERAGKIGVEKILLPNVDLDSIDLMLKLSDRYPDICYPMMGLHPTSVDKNYKEYLKQMHDILQKGGFCAVGEIGIDLYWDKTFLEEQKDAFRMQLSWAKEFNLPIVIHARDAFTEVFEILDEFSTEEITGVFHSFGGSVSDANKIMSYSGFKMGINGVVTFKNSKLDEVLAHVPVEKIVLETDAPYLTPVPFRGKRNEPSYLQYIIQKLVQVYNMSEEEIAEVTTANAMELFNLSKLI